MRRFALMTLGAIAAACSKGAAPKSDAPSLSSHNRQAEWRVPLTDSFTIHSAVASRDYQVTVAVPRRYAESTGKYPVLYVLDANWAFPIAVEMARVFAIGPKDHPTGDLKEEPIVVGIGYPVGLYWNAIPLRLEDFTPVPVPELVSQVARNVGFSPDSSGSGGAAAFLGFLMKEMIPAVEARYRIDSRRRALFGHSLGGLFATYALFHEPQLFESYLITSPALNLDHNSTWEFEESFGRDHKELAAHVFLAGGSLDEEHTAMAKKLDSVFQQRKYRGLVWHMEILDGETHSSVGALSLSRGIRRLYGDLRQ